MSQRTRIALERLVRDPRTSVYLLTGRQRADVEKRVAVPGVRCFGLHGWEGAAPVKPEAGNAQLLREARRQLRRRLSGLRGVWIEEKGPIFAVHARGATQGAARRAGDIVEEVVRSVTPGLRVMRGNQVWEITPPEMRGKGAAVRKLLGQMPAAARLSLYVGDDTTDESAFSVLRDAITVVVGARRPTNARFALRGPQDVCLFLERLGRELRVGQR
jgi:trehalose 6-phosphate phosphatase